jgi:aldehyde dehydrogenase (NAD+)
MVVIFANRGLITTIPRVDDAVRLANDSDLGLAGAVFTADPEAGLAVARRLRTGHVGVNCQGQDWVFPFGGSSAPASVGKWAWKV